MEVNAQPGIGIKPLLSLQRHYRISLIAWLLVLVLGLPAAFWAIDTYYEPLDLLLAKVNAKLGL